MLAVLIGDRADRGRRRLAGRGAALFGRQCRVSPSLYYFYKQIGWIAISMPVMILISMMPRERARRLSLIGAALFLGLLVVVPIVGPEAERARRWINFGVGQVQPSEFLKPFFVVSMAWLLSLKERLDAAGFPLSAALTGASRCC